MIFKKEYMNIYLVSAIIIAAFVFMGVSTWHIFSDISGQTSADLAIDREVDACWEKHGLDEKLGKRDAAVHKAELDAKR